MNLLRNGFALGAAVGGVFSAVLVSRSWNRMFAQMYGAGVVGQLDVARRIEAGRGEELVEQIVGAIPAYVQTAATEFASASSTRDVLYAARRFYETTDREVPESIRPLLARAPVRAVACYRVQSLCSTDTDCVPIPTSLRPVSDIRDPRGWEKGETLCGAKKVWWILREPCGAPLTIGSC